MSVVYVIGDTETSSIAFNDAIRYTREARVNHYPIIYLGDILVSSNIDLSVSNILRLFGILSIPIRPYLHPNSTIDDIKSSFSKLSRQKSLNSFGQYNRLYRQHRKYTVVLRDRTPIRTDHIAIQGYELNLENPPNYIFLFGNKEMEFIHDMQSLKMGIVEEGIFRTCISYVHRDRRHTNDLSISIENLNIILTYLNLCYLFVVYKSIILSHIYANALAFKDIIVEEDHSRVFSKVICGHSRVYGRYFDKYNPDIEVYVLDISCEPGNDVSNCIRIINDEPFFIPNTDIARTILSSPMDVSETFLNSKLITKYPVITTEEFFTKKYVKNHQQ